MIQYAVPILVCALKAAYVEVNTRKKSDKILDRIIEATFDNVHKIGGILFLLSQHQRYSLFLTIVDGDTLIT